MKQFLEIGKFIISLLTLFIAWRIYKNFDIKKSFLGQQLKVVFDLSNELHNFGLPTLFVGGGTASNYPRFFYFFNQQGIEGYGKIYFSNIPPIEIFPFIKFMHNPLLPKPIAEIIRKFDKSISDFSLTNELPAS